MSTKLILIRHGQSAWNLENRFTGWTDVVFTETGAAEAKQAAKDIQAEGVQLDVAFTSVQKRAIRTLWIVLDELDLMWLPVTKAWQLNERSYGALQGLNKAETLEKHGEAQVKLWRRGYAVEPPALAEDDPRHPRFDRRYAGLKPEEIPATESLAKTLARVLPYWEAHILPHLHAGRNVVVAAHGNSLRALVKHLDQISDDDITELNIPTGIPRLYEFDDQMNILDRRYLGDPAAAQAAAEAVAKQASAGKK